VKLAGFIRRGPDDLTSSLAQVVITSTFFDLRSLSAEDIANLIDDHAAFHDLRAALQDRIAEIPPGITNVRELEQALVTIAQQVLQDWERNTKQINKKFLSSTALAASQAFKAIKHAGHGGMLMLAGIKGLAIFLKGVCTSIPKKSKVGPYRYLSCIEQKATQNMARLYLPAWGQLALAPYRPPYQRNERR
jgi:hypothetical protein